MINAQVGTILESRPLLLGLYKQGSDTLFLYNDKDAIDQGFIEPYTPEHKPWRSKKGGRYYWLSFKYDIFSDQESYDLLDNEKYEQGNYYKSLQTAVKVARAQNMLFEWLHDGTQPSAYFLHENISQELLEAMDKAREAVLRDDMVA